MYYYPKIQPHPQIYCQSPMDDESIRMTFPGCGPITATTKTVYIRKIQGGYNEYLIDDLTPYNLRR